MWYHIQLFATIGPPSLAIMRNGVNFDIDSAAPICYLEYIFMLSFVYEKMPNGIKVNSLAR